MGRWRKPAEGSWTEHYPELGTGPVSFDDCVSAEFYAKERQAIFERVWLNVGREEQLTQPDCGFTQRIEIADAVIHVVRDDDGGVAAFRDGRRQRSVHCDVWNGFVFVNLDPAPRQGLREFLGPMITALDDYPFGRLTEHYDFLAHNDSNWKLFADAFQEYYHVPALHPQQILPVERRANATIEGAHYQLDGPHRLVTTGGARRWTLPPECMYPIERATRSGLLGPWEPPDLGPLPPGLNPGGVEPWGISNFQIFPNLEILIYGGWYLMYRYWPTSPSTHRFEATLAFPPARDVRERVQHEVAAVMFKEFALQDAGMLGGTQAALETRAVASFPLCDQEILVRHFHVEVAAWVERFERETAGVPA